MFEPSQVSCGHQLDELLEDPAFLKIIDLVTKEVMRSWGYPYNVAHGFVLSAIGEPATLRGIHEAWQLAKQPGGKPGLAKLIVRRRVIDLLRKDARQVNHCSLSPGEEAIEMDQLGTFGELVHSSPRAQLELHQTIQMVRVALACFASQGTAQRRQAQLLCRYTLDEVGYAELSAELGTSPSALRVRVHTATVALRRHIWECHGDLASLLERHRPE